MQKTNTPQSTVNQLMPRRDFLQLASTGLLGSMLLPQWANAVTPMVKNPAGIALQLYTVREELKADFAGTLKKVAAIGFKNVETAFWPEDVSLQKAGEHLRAVGLNACSCHIELPIGDKKQVMLDTAKEFNCTRMIWHGWPEDKRYSSLEGTLELVKVYNEANAFAMANGLSFGLHNHWWEYRNKAGNKFVYEVLLENLEKDIFFEIDTYWVKVAGKDPASIIKKFGNRAKFLHIKDGPAKWNENLAADNPDPMTAVGKGTQNIPSILKAASGNTEWHVIEMDKTATAVFPLLEESLKVFHKLNRFQRAH